MITDEMYYNNTTTTDYELLLAYGNFSSECSDFWMVAYATDIYDYILFAINFFSILANLYVCWSAVHFCRRFSEMSHLLVLSMTIADSALCILHQMRTVLIRFVVLSPMVNFTASIFIMAVTWISWSASGFSVILLNLEKIVYFHWPLNYNDYVTLVKTNVSISGCWILCTIYAVLLLATATYSCGEDICIVPHENLYRSHVILFCIVPALSSGVLSLYLWNTVRNKRKPSATNGRKLGSYQPAGAGSSPGGSGNNVNLKQQLKTVVFIFTTTGWIVLSWVPARLHFIFFLENCSAYLVWMGWAANSLMTLSPMVNPFITVLIYPCYRRLTLRRLKSMKRRKSSTTTTTDCNNYKNIHTPSIAADTPIPL